MAAVRFEELPMRLRNAAAGLIRAMRGRGITDADREAVVDGLKNNFCLECGGDRPMAQCPCTRDD